MSVFDLPVYDLSVYDLTENDEHLSICDLTENDEHASQKRSLVDSSGIERPDIQ